MNFTSGSLPRFPIRMTLFTLFISTDSFEKHTIAELEGQTLCRLTQQYVTNRKLPENSNHPNSLVETRLAASPAVEEEMEEEDE